MGDPEIKPDSFAKAQTRTNRRPRGAPIARVVMRISLSLALCVGLTTVVKLVVDRTDDISRTAMLPAKVRTEADPTSAWMRLSEAQRSSLHPLKDQWAKLEPIHQQRWLEVAAKLKHLPVAARLRAQDRMAAWATLSPEQRAQMRLRYVVARQLPTRQRTRLWKQYQAMPRQGPVPLPDSRLSMIGPATVRIAPGATTVLLKQLAQPGMEPSLPEHSSNGPS